MFLLVRLIVFYLSYIKIKENILSRFCASFWYMTVEERVITMILQPLGWKPSLFSRKKIMILHGFNN